MIIIDLKNNLAEIVQTDYRTAEVFKKLHLSFCCGAAMTLASACEAKHIDPAMVSKELLKATRNFRMSNKLPFHEWKIDFLIDFISNVHHEFILRVLPGLITSLNSFAAGHSEKYPEIIRVAEIVNKLSNAETEGILHAEKIIFPYVRQLDMAFQNKDFHMNRSEKAASNPLNGIGLENPEVQDLLNELNKVSGDFSITNLCSSYQVLIHRLKELNENIDQHLYLQNEILIPKAMAMEDKMLHSWEAMGN